MIEADIVVGRMADGKPQVRAHFAPVDCVLQVSTHVTLLYHIVTV